MKTFNVLKEKYPNYLNMSQLIQRSKASLEEKGFTPENTLFANCTCRDEINSTNVEMFGKTWGENFNLSGLAGLPSAGLTGFNAYFHHIPDNGFGFILFGAHIGLDENGTWGQIARRNVEKKSSVCGALTGALNASEDAISNNPLDMEMGMILKNVETYRSSIQDSSNPLIALTELTTRVAFEQIEQIIATNKPEFPIALLGGMFINTPIGEEDCFVPKYFEIQTLKNASVVADKLSL